MADRAHRLIRTFHSTCMVNDYDRTRAALAHIGGLRVLEYTEMPAIGRRGGMTWIGDNSIEVGQPIVKGHAAQRFLQRFGPGMHSYAFQVGDIDATIEHLGRGGVTVGARPLDWYCFTDPRTTGGLLFEWSDRTVPEDPRMGAPEPPFPVEPVLDVRTHAFVGAVVDDPIAWAETYAELFGLTEAFRDPTPAPGHPRIGVAAPDCVLALYDLPGDASMSLWGTDQPRSRFHILGLGVSNLDAAHAALQESGVRVLWRDDRFLAIDPADAGEVSVVVVEDGLPGDPRLA